jgi:hypothetical protein
MFDDQRYLAKSHRAAGQGFGIEFPIKCEEQPIEPKKRRIGF